MARRVEVKPGSDGPFIDLDLRGDAFYTQFARAFVWYCAPGSRKETLRHVWCIVGGDPAAADSIPPDNIALAVGIATVASMRRAHSALGNVDDLRPDSIDTCYKEFLLDVVGGGFVGGGPVDDGSFEKSPTFTARMLMLREEHALKISRDADGACITSGTKRRRAASDSGDDDDDDAAADSGDDRADDVDAEINAPASGADDANDDDDDSESG